MKSRCPNVSSKDQSQLTVTAFLLVQRYRSWLLECWPRTERGSSCLVSCPSPPTTATTTTTATSFGFFTSWCCCCCCWRWSGCCCQSGSASRTTWLAFFSFTAKFDFEFDGWPVKKDNIKRDLRSVSWPRHKHNQFGVLMMSYLNKWSISACRTIL